MSGRGHSLIYRAIPFTGVYVCLRSATLLTWRSEIIDHLRMQPDGYGAVIYIFRAPGPYLIFVSLVSPLAVFRGPPLLSPIASLCPRGTPRCVPLVNNGLNKREEEGERKEGEEKK